MLRPSRAPSGLERKEASRMRRLLLSTAIVLALSSVAPAAFAQAQLYLTQADIPARLSEQQLRNFLRARNARQINEEDDHRTWRFQVGTFFRRPPGDLEAHLLFYDVERGSRIFVTEMTVFLSNREETAFLQNVRLQRPMFKPRNRYIVVLTVRRVEMATANFELVGLQEERSGRVEFSDSDTRDPEQMSIAQQNAAAEAQRVAVAREQARQQEYEQAMREQQAAEEDARLRAADANDTSGGEERDPEVERAAAEIRLAGENPPEEGGCASCSVPSSAPGQGALATVLATSLAGVVVARQAKRRRTR
jgi:hypothetical protein